MIVGTVIDFPAGTIIGLLLGIIGAVDATNKRG
jgi:hypothetical protein